MSFYDPDADTPCRDTANDRRWWISELPAERDRAAELCKPCPVLNPCYLAGINGEREFGVWGGVDLTRGPK